LGGAAVDEDDDSLYVCMYVWIILTPKEGTENYGRKTLDDWSV
jgi:hypothetical protein